MALPEAREAGAVHLPGRDSTPPPPGATPLEHGDPSSIGRYRLVGRLGHGGMATVYLGDDDGLVAIKLIHSHLALDLEFLARFAREVELAKRVPEFCTAAVRESGVHASRPYLVTEYLDGDALHHLVGQRGPLNPAAQHNLAIGLAAGLTAIHGCDLVHRDLKPSNIMVTRSGIRIIDFGIARALDLSTNYTRPGLVMGSLGWAAPEQLDGAEATPAMDVFGWGCLIGYAATGRHPFGGTDATNRSWRILHAAPTLAGLPPALRELVGAALDRRAERRPTAQELLLALVGGRAATPAAGSPPPAADTPPPAADTPSPAADTPSPAAGTPPVPPQSANRRPAGAKPAAKPKFAGGRSAAGVPIMDTHGANLRRSAETSAGARNGESGRIGWSRAGKIGLVLAALPLAVALVIAAASSAGDPFWMGAGASAFGRATPAASGPPAATPTTTRAPGGSGGARAGADGTSPEDPTAAGNESTTSPGNVFGPMGVPPTGPAPPAEDDRNDGTDDDCDDDKDDKKDKDKKKDKKDKDKKKGKGDCKDKGNG